MVSTGMRKEMATDYAALKELLDTRESKRKRLFVGSVL